MLFNSYSFLLVFLPIALAGCYVAANRATRLAVAWLVVASLMFYGWWEWRHVFLLLASAVFNYWIGDLLARRGGATGRHGRTILAAGIGIDLAVLGYFKYSGFLAANAGTLFGVSFNLPQPLLPLGISFFTFTQIAYLIDVYRQPVRYRPLPYVLFVTYFPHLIAGPILHHKEMMPQFESPQSFRFNAADLAAGLSLLSIGLFKKVVLADGIAPYGNPVFEHAARGYAPSFLEAWGASLAFGLQLYFDFSAYSDMAVGLSKMLGIRMPTNFHSPYKATSIIEFWRRWHISLSRFLRDYLYFALGGSRRGEARRYFNLLATMVLGGLWHGAAWTFVIWGAVHGVLLAFNHAWRAARNRLRPGPRLLQKIERGIGAALTFIAVFAAWTLFKAADLPSAVLVLKGMAGLHGFNVPPPWLVEIGETARAMVRMDLGLPRFIRDWIIQHAATVDAGIPRGLADGRNAGVLISKAQLYWIALLLAIAWFAPNSNQIMARSRAFLLPRHVDLQPTRLEWKIDRGWALATSLLLVAALAAMTRISEFLYFQF